MRAPARRRRTRARPARRSGAARAQERHARGRYVWAAHAWKSWPSPPLRGPRPGPVARRPADLRPAPRASEWTGCCQASARPLLPAAALRLLRLPGQRDQHGDNEDGGEGQKAAPENMARSESTIGKDEKADHDGHHSIVRIQPIGLRSRGSAENGSACRRAALVLAVGGIVFMMRPSCRGPTIDAATTSMVAMLWSTGRIAHGALVSVQSRQGDAGRGVSGTF